MEYGVSEYGAEMYRIKAEARAKQHVAWKEDVIEIPATASDWHKHCNGKANRCTNIAKYTVDMLNFCPRCLVVSGR